MTNEPGNFFYNCSLLLVFLALSCKAVGNFLCTMHTFYSQPKRRIFCNDWWQHRELWFSGSRLTTFVLDAIFSPEIWHFLPLWLAASPSLWEKTFLMQCLDKRGEFLTRARRIQLGKPKDLQNMLSPEASYFLDVIFIFLLQKWIKVTHMLVVMIKCRQMKLGMYLSPSLTFCI